MYIGKTKLQDKHERGENTKEYAHIHGGSK